MSHRILTILISIALLFPLLTWRAYAQALPGDIQKLKEKVRTRAENRSKTKVKLVGDSSYVGLITDVGEDSFTITDKTGTKHSVKYVEVRSIGGTGLGSGVKIGIGIAIGAGAVLGVLAAIVASDN